MSTHVFHQLGEGITRVLEVLVSVSLAVILITTIVLVTLRYGFNSSIKGADEMANYLFIYMTALGAPAALFRGDHISLTILAEHLSRRWHRALDVLIQLLVGVVNVVILSLSFSWIQSVGDFASPVLRIPNWIIQLSVPIGCIATILICLLNILRVLLEGETIPTGEINADTAD